ncbi:Cytoskeletal protein [Schizosaccharomyces pombe]
MQIDYLLTAIFDPDRGPVLQYQCPENGEASDLHFLAELMLPDRVHERREDWSLFFIHFSKKSNVFSLFSNVDDINFEPSDSNMYYVLNTIRAKRVEGTRRGGSVFAMAICTTFPHVHALKPLLDTAWEIFDSSPSLKTLSMLHKSFNLHNFQSFYQKLSLDSSLILALNNFWSFFNLYLTNSPHIMNDIINKDIDNIPKPGSELIELSRDSYNSQATFCLSAESQERYVTCVIPSIHIPECVGEVSISNLINTFIDGPSPFMNTDISADINPINVLITALLISKKVLFLTKTSSASVLADFVLSSCALVSGATGLLQGLTRITFPYIDLSNVESLVKLPGYLAGVMNPAFTHHADWWDVLCDIDNQTIQVSSNLFSDATTTMDTKSLFDNTSPFTPISKDNQDDEIFIKDLRKFLKADDKETLVRWRVRLYIQSFIRKATSYEALFLESSPLNPYYKDYKFKGFGWSWDNDDEKVNELLYLAPKFEAWRQASTYKDYCYRLHCASTPVLRCMDIQFHLDRLRNSSLSTTDAAEIFLALESHIRTEEDVNYLLSNCPLHSGGLSVIAFGLYHISDKVRKAVSKLLNRIETHKYGKLFYMALNKVDISTHVYINSQHKKKKDSF